jgi:hypothetical protein
VRRAAVLLVAVAGCHAHVALPLAPTPAAPFAERARFFRRYRPSAMAGGARLPFIDRVELNDGSTVFHPDDLLQMVGAGSPLGAPVHRYGRDRTLATVFTWGSAALAAAGGLMTELKVQGERLDASVWAGAGLMVTGVIALIVGTVAFMPAANAARAESYEGLDRALRTRMNLCVEGDLVRDCAAPPGPPRAAR